MGEEGLPNVNSNIPSFTLTVTSLLKSFIIRFDNEEETKLDWVWKFITLPATNDLKPDKPSIWLAVAAFWAKVA